MTSTVFNTVPSTRGAEQDWLRSTGQPESTALQARIDAYRMNQTLPTATKAAAEALINDFIADMAQAPEDSHAVADFIARGLKTNSTFAFLALIAFGSDREEAYTFIEAIHDYAAAHGPQELANVSGAILPVHEHSADEDQAQDFANFWGTVEHYGVVVVTKEAVGSTEESDQTPLSGLDAVTEFARTSGPIIYRHVRHLPTVVTASSSAALTTTDSTASSSDDYPITEEQGSAVIVGVVAAEAVETEKEERQAVEVAASVVKGIEDIVESQKEVVVAPVAVKDSGNRTPVADVSAWLDAVRPSSFDSLTTEPRSFTDKSQMNTIAFPTMEGDAESVRDLVVEYPEAEGWPNYFALRYHAEQQQHRGTDEQKVEQAEELEVQEKTSMIKKKKKGVFRRTTSYIKKKAARVFGKRTTTSA